MGGCDCMKRGSGPGYYFGFKKKCWIITILIIILFILLCIVIVLIIILVPGSEEMTEYQKSGLKLHNEYRKKHGVQPFSHNKTLKMCSTAIKCAKYYSDKGVIDHKCPYKKTFGENLYRGGGGSLRETDETKLRYTTRAVNAWYNEIKDYKWNLNMFQAGTGHFTAIVWKNSKHMCMGTVFKGAYVTVVALYSPHGNIKFMYRTNVFPPT